MLVCRRKDEAPQVVTPLRGVRSAAVEQKHVGGVVDKKKEDAKLENIEERVRARGSQHRHELTHLLDLAR